MAVQIPDKSYFKIGEVSRILGVEPYNIRYWESQFKVVKPAKTKSRQRLYRRRDIEVLDRIKRLLYEEGFTIAGAKKRLKTLMEQGAADDALQPEDASVLSTAEQLAYDGLLAESQAELLELRTQVTTLQDELTLQRKDHAARIELFKVDRGELLERLEGADLKIVALEQQINDEAERRTGEEALSSQERDELQSKITTLEVITRDLREDLRRADERGGEIEALETKLNAEKERVSTLQTELGRARGRLELVSKTVREELVALVEKAE